MHTFHLHINGLVQGVGFRPHVFRIATEAGINGCVHNGSDGVHVIFNAGEEEAEDFCNSILHTPPPNAIITKYAFGKTIPAKYDGFSIVDSTENDKPVNALLLTPDISICPVCKEELLTPSDRRYHYPFTTCLHCGPRYSIVKTLPYDRANTTMSHLHMCEHCKKEYNDPLDIRHFSQTNSCPDCAIQMNMYSGNHFCVSNNTEDILSRIQNSLKDGKIIAIKGIGGYLLLCDATSETAVNELRKRKHRKSKPFAVLYPSLDMMEKDLSISEDEELLLCDKASPIVLCTQRDKMPSGLCASAVAPNLNTIGAMLPYTGLFVLITHQFKKPLVATSANLSGSPIIYNDKDALEHLFAFADFVVTYNRDIVMPQDDSVVQITPSGQKIILRRSRGLAPNYYPNPFNYTTDTVLAMGAELKGSWALNYDDVLYVSQFLGNQSFLESQNSYQNTLQHVSGLLKVKPDVILVDKHPKYEISQVGREMALYHKADLYEVQHHKAHFAAVLAENNLLSSKEKVLGVVWDGIGLGDDEQIWGGEFFVYDKQRIERKFHLKYFSYLLGDKMSYEPRLSAMSVLQHVPHRAELVDKYFSETELNYYKHFIMQTKQVNTSSMGRLLDAVASILGIQQYNSYEAEAAMMLEKAARSCKHFCAEMYSFEINGEEIDYTIMLDELALDIEKNYTIETIAAKLYISLASLIMQVSDRLCIDKIAFSGGVFQNAYLVESIIRLAKNKKQLYFHQQLSPNDECISFGQIAYHQINQE